VLAHAADAEAVGDVAEVEAVDFAAELEDLARYRLHIKGEVRERPWERDAPERFREERHVLADAPASDHGPAAEFAQLFERVFEFDRGLPRLWAVSDDLQCRRHGVADVLGPHARTPGAFFRKADGKAAAHAANVEHFVRLRVRTAHLQVDHE